MPYWNLYLQSISMSAEEIGLLSAVVVITKIFASPLWGWLVDHYGKRIRIIQICAFGTLICFSFALLTEAFWWLFIILFVFSIFWSAGLPLIEATTFSHLKDNNNDYTVIRIWGSISFIVGVLLLGKYLETNPISDIIPILIFFMSLVWVHSLTLSEHHDSEIHEGSISFLDILKRPAVIVIFMVCFLVQASHGPYYTFFSIYLEANDYSSSFIGIAWAVGVLAEVLIYLILHKVIKRWSLRWLMIVSLILASIRWLMIALFVNNVYLLLLAQLLHAASFAVYHAVAIQYIHREFRGAHQGRGQALYSSISFGAGLALGTLVSGYLWEGVGSMQTYLFAAALSSIAVVIAIKGLPD